MPDDKTMDQTQDQSQGTTQQKGPLDALQEDIIAGAYMSQRSETLDFLDDQIQANEMAINDLMKERLDLMSEPELIEVPEDFQISKLTRIGAALSNIRGNSKILDSLLKEKQAIANAQREAKATNVRFRNMFDLQRRQEIRADLNAARERQLDLEGRMAAAVDEKGKDIDQIRLERYDFALEELRNGRITPDEVARGHPWAMARRQHNRATLVDNYNTAKTNEMDFYDWVGYGTQAAEVLANPDVKAMAKLKLAQAWTGDPKITQERAEAMVSDKALEIAIKSHLPLGKGKNGGEIDFKNDDLIELNLWQAVVSEGTSDVRHKALWWDRELNPELRQKIVNGTATSDEIQQWIDTIAADSGAQKEAIKERKWRIATPKTRRVNYLQALRNWRDLQRRYEMYQVQLYGLGAPGAGPVTPTGLPSEEPGTSPNLYDPNAFQQIIKDALGGAGQSGQM